MSTREAREFDIVIYGATGYTGRLVAEYLAQRQSEHPTLKWALAGRDARKLAEITELVGAPDHTEVIIADSSDDASLARLAARAKVVLTTVGPYQLYGEPLLRACVRAGTDYADLCGEPLWMRAMIDAYSELARGSGARILFSCGFDSIPFDLGVLMLQAEAIERLGAPARRVKGRVRVLKGRFSGGTAASLKATRAAEIADPLLKGLMASPFALTPGFEGPMQPPADEPEFEIETGSWAAPFVMAAINTKNVHRTNFLLGHPWGTNFTYDEMMLTGPGERGKATALHLAATPMIGHADDPAPGEGPTADERQNGRYDVLFLGQCDDGRSVRYCVKGRYDPGYGSTCRMLAESGLALLDSTADGQIGTPGAVLGGALVDRLRKYAEIEFGPESLE